MPVAPLNESNSAGDVGGFSPHLGKASFTCPRLAGILRSESLQQNLVGPVPRLHEDLQA